MVIVMMILAVRLYDGPYLHPMDSHFVKEGGGEERGGEDGNGDPGYKNIWQTLHPMRVVFIKGQKDVSDSDMQACKDGERD